MSRSLCNQFLANTSLHGHLGHCRIIKSNANHQFLAETRHVMGFGAWR